LSADVARGGALTQQQRAAFLSGLQAAQAA
jgi:hypothetical protein